jgi:hypothetical protein
MITGRVKGQKWGMNFGKLVASESIREGRHYSMGHGEGVLPLLSAAGSWDA